MFDGILSRGYGDIITGTQTAPDDSVDVSSNATLKILIEANARGYRDLQLSTSGLAFQLVKLAKTSQLAKGNLKLGWTKFQEAYKPQAWRT